MMPVSRKSEKLNAKIFSIAVLIMVKTWNRPKGP